MKLAILIAASALAMSCGSAESGGSDEPSESIADLGNGVYRFVDGEAGVVCWVYDRIGPRSGISCLPMNELSIDANKRLSK